MSEKEHQILYVDDEQQNLFAFKATFRREYQVFTALNADEGFNILREHNIKLVIVDQRMPKISGVTFLSQVKLEFPKPVRIIVTGFSDIAAIIDAINSGKVYAYITKPWEKNEMKMSVQAAVEYYDLKEENRKLFRNLDNTMNNLNQTLHRFKQYIPESVVNKALNVKEESLLKGERRDVAVLFCDIRNFTELAELLKPEVAMAVLNEFYSQMTEVVLAHNGIVAQFIGDEVFAVFGAPVKDESKELNAVYCAMEMIEKSKKLNETFAKVLPQKIQLGIGINCGNAVVGNVGSLQRITYSVVGDMVNTAKRIESLTRNHPNTVLIQDSVYQRVANQVQLKAWDPIAVKGKSKLIQVYEVLGRKSLA